MNFVKGNGGQYEIMEFLRSNKGQRFTPKQIAENIKVSTSSVQRNIRKIPKSFIKQELIKRESRTPINFYWMEK